jgi:hypothetical protein
MGIFLGESDLILQLWPILLASAVHKAHAEENPSTRSSSG